ncbi:MAG: SseB family protein [Anaerolineaceae bacterium]|nr:SseB family protein [Anaerolineaceae bacterium]
MKENYDVLFDSFEYSEEEYEAITVLLCSDVFDFSICSCNTAKKLSFMSMMDHIAESSENPYQRKLKKSGVYKENKRKLFRSIAQGLMYSDCVWVLYNTKIDMPACTDEDNSTGLYVSLAKEDLEYQFESILNDQYEYEVRKISDPKKFFLGSINEHGYDSVTVFFNVFAWVVIDKSFFSVGENRKVEFMLSKYNQIDDEKNERRMEAVLNNSNLYITVAKEKSDKADIGELSLDVNVMMLYEDEPAEDNQVHKDPILPLFTSLDRLYNFFPAEKCAFLEITVKKLNMLNIESGIQFVVNPSSTEYILKRN